MQFVTIGRMRCCFALCTKLHFTVNQKPTIHGVWQLGFNCSLQLSIAIGCLAKQGGVHHIYPCDMLSDHLGVQFI